MKLRSFFRSLVLLTCGSLLSIKVSGASVAPEAGQSGVIPIVFDMPGDGYVTIVIEDTQGDRVRNLVSEKRCTAGENVVMWDGLSEAGCTVRPGTYRWRGIVHGGLDLEYQFSVYDGGASLPWFHPNVRPASDTGWLSDHNPPWSVCAVRDRMFIGALTSENGQSVMAVDLDGKKLWGLSHLRNVGASDFAYDGKYVYAGGEGQWGGANAYFFRIDPKTFEHEEIWNVKGYVGIRGMAAKDGRLYISSAIRDKIIVFDVAAKEVVQEVPLKNARGIAFTPGGRLLAISGTSIVIVEENGNHRVLADDHLTGPNRIAAAKDGTIFVTDGPLSWYRDSSAEGSAQYGTEDVRFLGDDQVKVFDENGTFVRTIGRRRRPGKYDPQSMRCPVGIAVDAEGRVWVCEWDMLPKRIGVWKPTGDLIKEFIGAHKYGGAGALDPEDPATMIYDGMMFKLDWEAGTWRLDTTFVDIMTVLEEEKHRPGGYGIWPTRIVWHNGERYFVGDGTIWKQKGDSVTAVAMVAPLRKIGKDHYLYPRLVECVGDKAPGNNNANGCCGMPGKWCGHIAYLMIWTDQNGDGIIQPKEVVIHDGPAYWLSPVHIGPGLTAYIRMPSFRGVTSVWRMPLAAINDVGAPRYDPGRIEPVAGRLPDAWISGDMTVDETGRLYMLATPLYGIDPTGERVWSYANDWPGLGAGAPRWKPGLVIAGYKMTGTADVGGDAGTVVALNSNFGQWYLFTHDGLFISTIFGDCRTSPYWGSRFKEARRGMLVDGASLGQESFHGWFGKTSDGGVYCVCGHPHCSIVRVKGLDTVKRVAGEVEVALKQTVAAASALEAKALRERKEQGTPEATLWTHERLLASIPRYHGSYALSLKPGGAHLPIPVWISYDEENLHLRAAMPHMVNKTKNALTLFAPGDAVVCELGLGANADTARTAPADGDVRVVLSAFEGKPAAVAYRYQATGRGRIRTRIGFVQDADVTLEQIETETGPRTVITAHIPWKALTDAPPKFETGMELRGDVGVILADHEGSAVVNRVYWANEAGRVVSDINLGVRLMPHLWGIFRVDEE